MDLDAPYGRERNPPRVFNSGTGGIGWQVAGFSGEVTPPHTGGMSAAIVRKRTSLDQAAQVVGAIAGSRRRLSQSEEVGVVSALECIKVCQDFIADDRPIDRCMELSQFISPLRPAVEDVTRDRHSRLPLVSRSECIRAFVRICIEAPHPLLVSIERVVT
jgi:hypothetical protein